MIKLKRGDTVKIMIGKDAGRQGKIIRMIPSTSMAVVEGINMFKKHVKGDGKDKESAIVDIVKPVPLSNLRLVCKLCNKPVKVGFEITDGSKYRVCKACGKPVDTVEKSKKSEKAVQTKKKTTVKAKAKTENPRKKAVSTKKTTTKSTKGTARKSKKSVKSAKTKK